MNVSRDTNASRDSYAGLNASRGASRSTLAELAITYPSASRVFHREGLDYCCGGKRSLEEVCAARGLDAASLMEEIERTETPDARSWSDRPLNDLITHIVDHYHRSLREELPQLVALAAKVETRHADKESCPRGLAAHLDGVLGSLLEHMSKEEQVLFPMIQGGYGKRAAGPVQAMEHEHHDHAESLRRTRALAHDLVPPEEACTSWRALYLRLNELEADLMEHIHLENNVLFPRALFE
jgi:regulator of cell morphogenesis and NO signaling